MECIDTTDEHSTAHCFPDLRLKSENLFLRTQVPVHCIPTAMKWRRSLPGILRIPKPESQQVPLLSRLICETVARMKDAQVVNVLDIALLEVQSGTVLIGGEVQGI